MSRPVLLVKTSSLGDVLHLLPALSDVQKLVPGTVFHWVVEEGFAEVATWHPTVEKVIPIALRRWRKQPWQAIQLGEISTFLRSLKTEPYEQIIDAQGLLKSALVARLAKGTNNACCGFDRQSARESWASWFYQRPLPVARNQHALVRLRQLFAQAFNYSMPQSPPDYGLEQRFASREKGSNQDASTAENYWVFLHGTTWASKHWPEEYWLQLARLMAPHGRVIVPWGSDREQQRAKRIAEIAPDRITVSSRTNLTQLAQLLAGAKAVISVDTGPAHLAAAVGAAVVVLYGSTNPQRIGTIGQQQHYLRGICSLDAYPQGACLKRNCPLEKQDNLHPPCFRAVTPEQVWQTVQSLYTVHGQ